VTSRRWVAIDFETASRERASACALGLAVIEGDRVVERRGWLIQPPGNYYEYMNTRIHGIDEDMTAQSPEFDEAWVEIDPYLKGSVLLAHNAPFDMSVLRACLQRYAIAPPRIAGYHCTVTVARRVWPQLADHKLSSVCRHCGIALNHHDATSDANGCAHIALACLTEVGVPNLDDLADELGLRAGRL
jgi:DNA polymerase-3 subunit epsilon